MRLISGIASILPMRMAVLTLICISLAGCSLTRLAKEPSAAERLQDTRDGTIASLDEDVFSERYAKKGYWKPSEFYQQVGATLYFQEAYDPARIPILFVHGAAGSPRDWRYFSENIDWKRYQAWFLYYPSGASIDEVSHLLFLKLADLQARYHFEELYVTAHSMGGLVVRSLLTDYGNRLPYVTLFVSISTPWGGEPLAELGVRHSPIVIPAWNDLRPEGLFLKALFETKPHPGPDYYLFFGFKGRHGLLRPNNDGAITLKSQLAPPAQAEAKMVHGFNESHTSILRSKEVLAQYNAVLEVTDKRRRSSPAVLQAVKPMGSRP